ncbi:MAG: cob(I)yrinic acid a,c-diamide adenosyltransferase [Bacteroidia bacterium]|nr:cob(I)yrinic acid a,c-diamide adenosyltransferase [Bacteroidia bacterium]
MAFKIYTKTGDKGQTSLIGGTRIPKFDVRIEAYGTVDELNSYIGLIRDQAMDTHAREILIEVQDRLFTIGSLLAADPVKNKMTLPQIVEGDVKLLEEEMDSMDKTLPEMKSFVLPGGHTTVSFCHIARCVCRRAERCVLKLNEQEAVNELIYKYLNRLSDYLFVLSRKLTMDVNATETPWKPRV